MSIYSDIIKKVGLKHLRVSFPNKEKATELYSKVTEGNIEAFEEVFRIYRHAPYTGDNEAMEIIMNAYNIGANNLDWR